MKKLIAITIAAVMLFAYSVARADTVTGNVDMTINVDYVFGFDITGGQAITGTVVPFDPDNPDGYTRTIGGIVDIRAHTNLGQPWRIGASSSGLPGLVAPHIIPASIIMVNSWQAPVDGDGTCVDPAVSLAVPLTIYTNGLTELSDTDVPFAMGVSVDVPWEQETDSYQGIITLTMTSD